MRKQIKTLLGKAAHATGVDKSTFSDRGTIVLFHRVDDRLKDDPISCGVDAFREYCRYFARHFDVISLDEMLRRTASGDDLTRTLTITFDDGYLDNAVTAAPILKEHGLTATFYIASDFIGSDFKPWWDEHLPFRPQWMTWDDVRHLRDDGFTIGGHTANHVDLGKVDVATAEQEITRCKARLEAELGQTITQFSFPYGRRENIRPETLALVRAAGFHSCVSAFGGLVTHNKNLFEIPREPLSPWYATPYQFAFELLMRNRRNGTAPRVYGDAAA
ncbi:MAG: polysaccharide deacetylase family protein [Hyphomicrobiaceae bacterium]